MARSRPEQDSFERFVADAMPALTRYARALTHDDQAAQELVQDTLVRIIGAWRRAQHTDNPAAYATTTMFRTYVSLWRRRQSRPDPLVLIDEPVATGDGFAHADTRVMLDAALAALPSLQRAVLVATYLEDAPDETIAKLIGRTPSTVRSLRRRGLASLRGVIAASGDQDRAGDRRPPRTTVERVSHVQP